MKKYIFFFGFFFLMLPLTSEAAFLRKPVNNLGLVGYWSFEDAKGTDVTDFSGGGHNGTLTNGDSDADWVDGKRGTALAFDGSEDSYVDFGAGSAAGIVDFTGDFTVSLWAKRDADNGFDGFFSVSSHAANGWNINFRDTNHTFALYSHSGGYANSDVPGDANNFDWHHLVAVSSSGTLSLYVNGDLQTNTTNTPSSVIVSNATLGRFYTANTDHDLDGKIDEVRIYNRALSASEVTSLYNSGQVKYQQPTNRGLVGYWSFEDGRGTDATDFSGNGNHGTLTNMADADWVNGKFGKALDFDGTAQYVSLPVSTSLTISLSDELTISAWVKIPESHSGYGRIVAAADAIDGNPYSIGTNSAGTHMRYIVKTDSGTAAFDGVTSINGDGQWHHVVLTWDGATIVGYLDNAVDNSSGRTGTLETPTEISIGYDEGRSNFGLDGDIDEVRIYNRALSVDEISTLYNSGLKGLRTLGKAHRSTLTDGLVSYHSFDGPLLNTTTSTDVVSSTYNGTLNGGPSPAIGTIGQALNFAGDNDYISTAAIDPQLNNAFTVSAWIYPHNNDDIKAIVSTYDGQGAATNDGFQFRRQNDDILIVINDGAGSDYIGRQTSGDHIQANQWYHVVATWDGTFGNSTGFDIYIDGVDLDTTDFESNPSNVVGFASEDPMRIGAVEWGSGLQYFDGLIDEVRVYDRALSTSEVQRLYTMGR